jgi:hypothetical protein
MFWAAKNGYGDFEGMRGGNWQMGPGMMDND